MIHHPDCPVRSESWYGACECSRIPGVLHPPDDWAAWDGLTIYDPDGWRKDAPLGEKSMTEPITYDEYRERMFISTIGPRRV